MQRNNEVEIVTYWHPKRIPQENIHDLKQDALNRVKNFLNYFFFALKVSMRTDFDVIHAANVPEAIPAVFVKLIRGKPLVTSVHDTGFIRVNPQWSAIGALTRRFLRKFACKMSDQIIVPTEGIKDQIVENLLINPSNFTAIHYGVDKKRFNLNTEGSMRKQLKISESTFVIYFSGMFYPKKGLEYAIEAMKFVRERTENFVFVIDGVEIFPGYLDKLKSIRDNLGLTEKVLFPGLSEERERWFADCDVFVLPSVDTEGLSLTCLEAGSCGKPVVTTTVLEGTEAVIKDKTALIVQPRNPKALADAIMKLMDDEELRKNLGDANYEYAQNFDWEKTAAETENVYRKAIGV